MKINNGKNHSCFSLWFMRCALLIILYALCIIHCALLAQDFTISAYVDRNRVVEGEVFRLTVEAKGDGFGTLPNPDFPADMPFTVLGSSRGSSSQISWVNGRTTTQKTETVTFNLRAGSVGTYQIPALSVIIGGKPYHTQAITVSVIENTGQQQRQQPQTSPYQHIPQQTYQQRDGSEMFILATPNKRTVYRDELIVVHYKLYTQSQIQSLQMGNESPFTGFWKEDLDQDDRRTWSAEIYDGQRYNTLLVRSTALFPSREGNMTIPTFEMNIDVYIPSRDWFTRGTSRRVRVSSQPINITVNPLPPVEPELNFIGAVGRFDVSSSISANEGQVGNNLTYRITVSGTGNYNQITAPVMPTVQGLRFMTPEINDQSDQSNTTFSGRRTFAYPVILQDSGTLTIPELTLTWFDTANRRYQSKTLPKQVIEVRPSEHQVVSTLASQQTIRVMAQDIQIITMDLSQKSFKFLYQSAWFWILLSLLLSTLVGHYLYIKEMQRLNVDNIYRRDRRAHAVIKKYLKAANQYAKQNSTEFYDSAYIGLTHFLTDKLNLPRGSTEKLIFEALKDRGCNEDTIHSLKVNFERINFVKYSSAESAVDNISADYEALMNLINSLMVELGKKIVRAHR